MPDLKRSEDIVADAARFSEQTLKPAASACEENGGLTRDIIQEMGQMGFLGAAIPHKYGGSEIDPIAYGRMTEQIGKGCVAAQSLLTVHSALVGESLTRWGSGEQKERWLPDMAAGRVITAFGLTEPQNGSDAGGIQTRYQKDGDAYILNGRKQWISFAAIADLFIIVAINGKKASAFLVDSTQKGVTVTPQTGLMAARASHLAQIDLHDVRVGTDRLLGREGGGFSYVVSTALDHGRYSIAWASVALAQAALEEMIAYCRTRSQFGQRLHGFQLIQGIIGDAVTHTHAARALCLKAGRMRMDKDPDAVNETCMAKYFASTVAMKISHDAFQVHGANGFSKSYRVERLFRESKVLEIIEGSSQIMQVLIAKYGLNRYYSRKNKLQAMER